MSAAAPRGLPVWALVTAVLAAIAVVRTAGVAVPLPGPRGRQAAGLAAALVALAAASVLWSPSRRAGITVAEIAYIALAAVSVGTWIARASSGAVARAARLCALGVAVGTGYFVVEALLGFPLHRLWNDVPADWNLMETNVPKRTAAVLALLVWPAGLVLARGLGRSSGSWAGNWAGFAAPAFYAAAALLLSSRSALFGMAVGAAVFLLAVRWAGAVRHAIAAALVLAFALVVPVSLALTAAGVDTAGWLFPSARHRVEIWGHAAARVLEAPLLGHGIDASRALAPEGAVSRFGPLTDSLLPLHPHNAYLQVWLELGGAGATVVLALALLALGSTRRLAAAAQPYALALYACGLAMASTAYGLWQAWWMAGFLAAGLSLALAARRDGLE